MTICRDLYSEALGTISNCVKGGSIGFTKGKNFGENDFRGIFRKPAIEINQSRPFLWLLSWSDPIAESAIRGLSGLLPISAMPLSIREAKED